MLIHRIVVYSHPHLRGDAVFEDVWLPIHWWGALITGCSRHFLGACLACPWCPGTGACIGPAISAFEGPEKSNDDDRFCMFV